MSAYWKPDRKCRADAIASDIHHPTVSFHQFLDKCQTDAETIVPTRGRTVSLSESVPHVREETYRDTLAIILNFNGDPTDLVLLVDQNSVPINESRPNRNASPFGSKLDRIRQQIPDHLLHASRIHEREGKTLVKIQLQLHLVEFCRVSYYLRSIEND
jgi:hypothetical protein